MPTLLFFAQAREAAGTKRWECAAPTVGEAIDLAVAHFGGELERIVPHCKVWVNGEPAERTTLVLAGDELALLPPVSGG